MVFNSITFLIFLAIVLVAYYRLKHRAQNILLVAASYLFYGWWDWRFVALLFGSTAFDFACARWIDHASHQNRRRLLLTFSIIVNLGVLGLFKYFNFFADSLGRVLAALGMEATFPVLHVILPVGISFYTFLSMSYTIDVYRRELPATNSLLDYMLYVAFFPHLVAGPIVRASFLLPQCERPRRLNPTEITNGIWLILMGYTKKVVIADRLADIANWGFSSTQAPFSDANAWLVLYAFAFQIYGDFSGYSDIARGLSKLMGFELTHNFKAPYLVTNPSAFWQHWHISLSTWLRDYLYIPLGGNRHGPARTFANLMITMILGGLWHGAGIAFVLWGVFHGALLAGHRAWQSLTHADPVSTTQQPRPAKSSRANAAWLLLLIIVFFHITCVGWLLFRAGSVSGNVDQVTLVMNYLAAVIHWPASISSLFQPILMLGALAMLFQWQHDRMERFAEWPVRWQAAAVVLALTAITALGVFEGAQFIYFQF
jgi:alginate O-acetyltransferase complex protein AlgI